MLEFDPVLFIGVEEIDRQHQEIFDRVRRLLQASRERRGREEVRSLVEFLGTYVLAHFASEERAMARSAYPRVEEHRAEHRQLAAQLEILRDDLEARGATALLAIRVGSRVTEWLRDHIYRTDRTLGEWIRSRPR